MKRRIVVRVANCAGVSNPRLTGFCVRMALTEPGIHGLPDVVLLSEVSPVNVAAVARKHAPGWYVVQRGRVGSPAAGVAIASRAPIRSARSLVGSVAGFGIRMRPVLSGSTLGARVTAVHAPPARAPLSRARYIARARTRRGLVGGDWNRRPGWMRRTSTRTYRGIGVLGVLVPRHWAASKASGVDIGSDHPAVDVVVHIPAWRTP